MSGSFLCGFLAMLAFLLAIAIAPFLSFLAHPVLPNTMANFLFFAPQYVFPYAGFWPQVPNPRPIGDIFSFAQWMIVIPGYGILTARVPCLVAVILALPTIVLVTVVVHFMMPYFGYEFLLDGP